MFQVLVALTISNTGISNKINITWGCLEDWVKATGLFFGNWKTFQLSPERLLCFWKSGSYQTPVQLVKTVSHQLRLQNNMYELCHIKIHKKFAVWVNERVKSTVDSYVPSLCCCTERCSRRLSLRLCLQHAARLNVTWTSPSISIQRYLLRVDPQPIKVMHVPPYHKMAAILLPPWHSERTA